MTSAAVFKFKTAGTTYRIALAFKWGDDLYGMLMARLKEYGYVPDGKKKIYAMNYCNDNTVVEDTASLWGAIEEGQFGSPCSPIMLEAHSKPPKRDEQGTCGVPSRSRRSRSRTRSKSRSKSRSESRSTSRSGSRTARSVSASENGSGAEDGGATSEGRRMAHGRKDKRRGRRNNRGGRDGGETEKRLRRLEEQLEKLMKTLEKRH